MSEMFDLLEGFREATRAEYDAARTLDSDRMVWVIGRADRYWIREEPVPALPTEPYTVIRVTWKDEHRVGARVLMNLGHGVWDDSVLREQVRNLSTQITDFEILAEPRAVTAKAVLDRMHEESGYSVTLGITLAKLARDFGADQ